MSSITKIIFENLYKCFYLSKLLEHISSLLREVNFDMRYLAIHDVDAIQKYVFATGRLREIRGASALIDRLNREESRNLAKHAGGDLIYYGGGGIAVDFTDRGKAHEFCQSISKLYVDETYSATSTGIVECYDENKPDRFPMALERAYARLRQEKVSQYRRTQLLTNSLFKSCQSCGIYPASQYISREEAFVCQSCYIKNQQSRELEIHKHIWNKARENGKQIYFPTQIDHIGDPNYIGIIYADANRMGDRLPCIRDKQSLGEFSKVIDIAVRNAITEVILKKCNGSLQVMIPLCGGDDLVAIVPSKYAFELAIDYIEEFQNQVRQNLPDKVANMLNSKEVSACAGVAIAKSHTPLSELFDLSHDLCKSAKQRSYDIFLRDKTECPCVDFQVVTTPSWGDLDEVRKTEYLLNDKIRLTSRPYTVNESRKLICAVNALKQQKFPLSKLHDLFVSLRRGKDQAIYSYLHLYVRARESRTLKQRTALSDVACCLGINNVMLAPWKDWGIDSGTLQTPYGDLVEIYEFV